MKKVFASAVAGLAFGAVSAVSALDLSVGGGGFFASDFGGGMEFKASMAGTSVETTIKTPYMGGGAYLFFDAAYAEISVGYLYGSGKWSMEMKETGQVDDKDELDYSFSALSLGLLGKYPIALSDNITLFPAVGIDYQLSLAGETKSGGETEKWDGKNGNPESGDFSALIFKFGAGLDVALTDKVYLRPELLYGIRLASKVENDMVDEWKEMIGDPPPGVDLTGPKTRLGHGLTVKVGVGYKF